MKKFIVTTTINNVTPALRKFDEMSGWHLIAIGDKKTPNLFETHYEVLSKIELSLCDSFATQLSNCSEAYLIRIGRHTGGSIGWIGSYYVFGIFKDKDDEKYLVPLKVFKTINSALNSLNDYQI